MSILFSAIGFVDPISKKTFNKKFSFELIKLQYVSLYIELSRLL